MLNLEAHTPSNQAKAEVATGLLAPLVFIVTVALLWVLRWGQESAGVRNPGSKGCQAGMWAGFASGSVALAGGEVGDTGPGAMCNVSQRAASAGRGNVRLFGVESCPVELSRGAVPWTQGHVKASYRALHAPAS